MKNKGLAKTEREKTIKEHTEDLLCQYKILKYIYPNIMNEEEWNLLKEAVIYHDLGKINSKFQNKLYRILGYEIFLPQIDEREEIPHNFLSPLFIDTAQYEAKYGSEKTKILLSSVYYHHDREEKQIQKEDIEDLRKQAEYLKIEKPINMYSRKYILKSDKEKDINILKSKLYILIKGLLNKLDYVASLDKRGVNVEEKIEENGMTVADKIKEITKEKYHNNYREVQTYMMANTDKNLVVISYTGSGKTEAALLWLGKEKAFYTLPLKVSINAMYQRIVKDIGYHKALLLHSDARSYYENEEENDVDKYDRARRMSAPLIITTIDQLFKIAFQYKGYEEILATLSYSKVVIDEIQMYSSELLAYIFVGLKMITKMGGKFAIITATFPPLLYSIMDLLEIPYQKQEKDFMAHIKNRHKIKLIEENDFDYGRIREKAKDSKVLIIVNTIKRAQEIYENLQEENVHLLHSHYIKEDRDILEDAILEFGDSKKNKEFGIWISTQIVEASLDIDFDVLFTEMCSIDSLLQRMGRVYRKRQYDKIEANVYILDNRNGVPYIIDSEIYDYTLEELKKYDNQNLTEDIKQNMIENIFDFDKNPKLKDSKYYKQIKSTIKLLNNINPNSLQKQEINEKFREIQNISLIPDNVFEVLENEGKIERWKRILNSKTAYASDKIKAKEEIKNYIINVRWSPKIIRDQEELFYKQSNIYRTSYVYDFDKKTKKGKGLIMKEMQNIGYFDE